MLPTIEQIQEFSDHRIISIARDIDGGFLLAFPDELIKDEHGYTEADYYVMNINSELELRKKNKWTLTCNFIQ